MTGMLVQVVQFVHPGFEYRRPGHVGGRYLRSGVMSWKPGNSRHDRKFMLTRGSLLEWGTRQDHRSAGIVFWGEWGGPSVFWKLDGSPGKPMAGIIHAPFRPTACPSESVQNTDPMVFGDAFIYSNCLQQHYVSLRTLSPGSMILFGRHSRADGQAAFSLDTCLIIDRVEALVPRSFLAQSYGTDLLADAVLSPLHSEGADDHVTVYFGRNRERDEAGPFSFFPARAADRADSLFPRPRLSPSGRLRGVVSPEKMQGIKVASVSIVERDAIWEEVASQVTEQGCALGYYAAPPPLLDSAAAEAAVREPPAPLSAWTPPSSARSL
jgi:hypothetical protein